ncbi:tripartite motif-containing protein 16-like protein [Astyanax mexicanus]|uniref:tripartite motif-containing protein 16-like protein n=1 Tax=Astyanax mexicanus TaxID=7994 RepID=UPI0020CAD709|nr:tripartite motif-containing protein 16-like protein [Astyanax mexicanus]
MENTEEGISPKKMPEGIQPGMENHQEETNLAPESKDPKEEATKSQEEEEEDQIDACNGTTNASTNGTTNSPTDPPTVEVTCDSCMENPRLASKSCLTCQVSYCEEHLRPHLENSKFQTHKLVEPQLDMELRTCPHHHLDLELYCTTDSCCICASCGSEGHHGHSIVPIGEARKQIEGDLQQKQKEMVKKLSAAEQAITKLQGNTESIESSVTGVRAEIEQQFSDLQAAVEDAQKSTLDVLEGEYKQALGQAESIQAHIEQRITELKKTMAQVERLPRKKNDVDFLQEYTEWRKGLVDVCLPGVYISLIDQLDTFSRIVKETTKNLCEQLTSTYSAQLKELCESEKLSIKTMVQPSSPTKRQSSEQEPITREDFLKYASNLTFNPDSTHKFLRLTEDNRKASNTTPWQHNYPDTPDRFEHWRQVMTCESLYLGRHYFEVELTGEGAYLGLTYKSIDRKGQESSSCITGNDFSWSFGRESHGYSAWHCDAETPVEVGEFSRIGLYMDYEKGLLAFYGVADTMNLLHMFTTNYLEPLYPVFWLSKKDNKVVLVKPGD